MALMWTVTSITSFDISWASFYIIPLLTFTNPLTIVVWITATSQPCREISLLQWNFSTYTAAKKFEAFWQLNVFPPITIMIKWQCDYEIYDLLSPLQSISITLVLPLCWPSFYKPWKIFWSIRIQKPFTEKE